MGPLPWSVVVGDPYHVGLRYGTPTMGGLRYRTSFHGRMRYGTATMAEIEDRLVDIGEPSCTHQKVDNIYSCLHLCYLGSKPLAFV